VGGVMNIKKIFTKKPKPILEKKYKFQTTVYFKDGNTERWVTDHTSYVSIFKWSLYRNLWKWFYLRDSDTYSVVSDFNSKDSLSMKTFNRKDIRMISGTITPYVEAR
jgi:hypothetical protein